MKFYSKDQVKKHNKKNDCWIILYDNVYDITKFMKTHTGKFFPLQIAGGDGTALFESIHPKRAKEIIESKDFRDKYYKGALINNESKFDYDSNLGKVIKLRVQKYFESVKNTPEGRGCRNEKICVYSKFLIITILTLYCKYFQLKTNNYLFSILYGLCMLLIIFNITHGANHGELIKNYPYAFSKICENYQLFLGANSNDWKNWHNASHHQFTNTSKDRDANRTNWNRFHMYVPYKKMYKYQHIYTWFLIYPLTHIYAFIFENYQLFWYLVYIAINLFVIKYLNFDLNINFLYKLIIESVVFGYIFVMINHITHENLLVTYENKEKGCWYKNQINTTANWKCDNLFITHLLGGINHQIEHHLFQSVHHYHYPAIRKIIKKICNENNITYNEFKSYMEALGSHYKLLKKYSNDVKY